MPIGSVLTETPLVLDTNILTAWRFQRRVVVAEIQNHLSRFKFLPALTAITVHEALYGFENKTAKSELDEATKRGRMAVEQLINSCTVLPFDQRSAEIAAFMVPRLRKNIPKESLLDALIAATALAHGYGVATGDRGFELIARHTPVDMKLRLAFWAV